MAAVVQKLGDSTVGERDIMEVNKGLSKFKSNCTRNETIMFSSKKEMDKD